MHIDATVIAAVVAAISAIVAPVVTTAINNRHQYKMRKLEIIYSEKLTAIREYTESCSNYLVDKTLDAQAAYYKSYGRIFLYTNKKHWENIQGLHSAVSHNNFEMAAALLEEVCQDLSVEIKV